MEEEPRPGLVDRALRIFADVRAGEGASTLLLTLTIFFLMVGYYVIKVVREPWILMLPNGAELKSYAAGAQAGVLILYVPLFAWFASRYPSRKLVFYVVGFFLACVELFWFASRGSHPWVGFVFFVWVGLFSTSVIALFWSFANDGYRGKKGERLFPVVTVGMTAGPVVGSKLADFLVDREYVAVYDMLQVAAGLLLVHLLLYAVLVRRPDIDLEPIEDGEESAFRRAFRGFRYVFENGYIRWIALLLILLNLVNTTGEYILGVYARERAAEALAALGSVEDPDAFKANYIGSFYADFFFWVNTIAVTAQALVASRLVKYFGIAGVLLPLPIIALGNYALVAFGAGYMAFRVMKTTENSADYSLMNNAKAMLWLPTTREEKYSAKQAVDTFFVRLGDLFSAGAVFLGTNVWSFGKVGFAYMNGAVILVWLGIAWILVRAYNARAPKDDDDDDDAVSEPA